MNPPIPKQNGCLIILGIVLASAAITVAVCLLLIWRNAVSVTDEARRMGATVAAEFNRALNVTPEVLVNSVVVVAASTPVTELVVLEKKALVRHTWQQTWMHSTKNFEIEATFTAKAGFDLSQPFRIRIDPVTHNMSADLPRPKILSLGMGDVRVLRDEDGLWNKLTAQDREDAFRALEKQARLQFADSTLVAETAGEAEKRVRQILASSGRAIEFSASQNPETP